ncbi:MAG: Calx-beta domain-containing protein, partial [Aliarcobacter sp.]|nr:Calx-beta domain-containing protein [Aliarcobacter sp.]
MKLTIKSQGQDKVVDLSKDLQFNVSKGEQYIFSNGFTSYVLSFKDNQKSVELTFKVDGKTIKVELKGIVPFLQENIEGMQNPTLVIINKSLNEKEVDNIVNNDNFNGSEIIDRLEALLSQPVDLGSAGPNDKMAIISDFQSLVETLDAAAAGGEQGGNSNGSTFNSIFSSINDSLNGIADTDRWVNLTESISSIPVDTGNTIAQVEAEPEAVIVPKDPKDPIVEVPKDPNDPTKPLDPKDPSVGTKGAVAIEGNDLVFTVTVTQSVNVQTYDFKITDGTATLGEDYTSNNVVFTNGVTYDAVTGKITVPAGVTAFEVNVKTIDDAIIENTESLTVSVGTSSAVGYILDNDIEGITIDPNPDPKDPNDPKDLDSKGAKVTEGDTAEFKVTLTESSSDQVVNVAIATGSATKGADFLNASETESITVKYADGSIVTIAANVDGTYSVPVKAGQTNFVVQVKTFDDAIIENEENFTLTVKVADKQATSTGTILDND